MLNIICLIEQSRHHWVSCRHCKRSSVCVWVYNSLNDLFEMCLVAYPVVFRGIRKLWQIIICICCSVSKLTPLVSFNRETLWVIRGCVRVRHRKWARTSHYVVTAIQSAEMTRSVLRLCGYSAFRLAAVKLWVHLPIPAHLCMNKTCTDTEICIFTFHLQNVKTFNYGWWKH